MQRDEHIRRFAIAITDLHRERIALAQPDGESDRSNLERLQGRRQRRRLEHATWCTFHLVVWQRLDRAKQRRQREGLSRERQSERRQFSLVHGCLLYTSPSP